MNGEKELVFEQEYTLEMNKKLMFYLYHSETEDGREMMELTYRFTDTEDHETTCKRIFYDKIAASYQHEMLSWYNLICCSNEYGPIPVVDYMNYAVQNGKKLAATIYPKHATEYIEIMHNTQMDYYVSPYNPMEYEYLLYISRMGKIEDYFDIDRVIEVYKACDVHLDEERFRRLCAQELSYFDKQEKCGIELHDCYGEENLATVGLLFGYPIESTIAFIKGDIDLCQC